MTETPEELKRQRDSEFRKYQRAYDKMGLESARADNAEAKITLLVGALIDVICAADYSNDLVKIIAKNALSALDSMSTPVVGHWGGVD